MMEYWNVGLRLGELSASGSERRLGPKSGKRSILQKMLYLHFMMMLVRPSISIFSQKIRHSREKTNTIIFVLILYVHHPIFPKPSIPVFHHSNCERSELCSPLVLLRAAFIRFCIAIAFSCLSALS